MFRTKRKHWPDLVLVDDIDATQEWKMFRTKRKHFIDRVSVEELQRIEEKILRIKQTYEWELGQPMDLEA